MHHMDGVMHTNTEGLYINTWKGAEVGILFGTEHQLQMWGDRFGAGKGPRSWPSVVCSFLWPRDWRVKWPFWTLRAFVFFGNFPVGLSSLMPSLITVQMIIFPAPLPKSHRSLAFPAPTRKWPGRGLSIAWLFSIFSEAAMHLSPSSPISNCWRSKRLGKMGENTFYTSAFAVRDKYKNVLRQCLQQHGDSRTHLQL